MRESVTLLSAGQLRNATTIELHQLQDMIAQEINNRRCTGPFLIASIGIDGESLLVNEVKEDFDERKAETRYVLRHPENVKTYTLYKDRDTVFHHKPHAGDVFEIELRHGHIIEYALLLEEAKNVGKLNN